MPRIWTCLAMNLVTFIISYRRVGSLKARRHTRYGEHRIGKVFRSMVSVGAGIFDPLAPIVSGLNLALNLVCVAMCLDFIYRAHLLRPSDDLSFSRMGYVTPDSALISLRVPGQREFNLSFWPHTPSPPVTSPPNVIQASSSVEVDWTATVALSGLSDNVTYSYSTSAGHRGSFVTPPRSSESFTVLSTSCQKPNWPYSPLNDPLRIIGMEYLDAYISKMAIRPEMMLFLGDFICESPTHP
jgi:alkaline phosphatase D